MIRSMHPHRHRGTRKLFLYLLALVLTWSVYSVAAYRLYRAAYGDNQPFPNPDTDPRYPGENKKLPSYAVFVQDRARVPGGANLAQAQLALADDFAERPEFLDRYPANLTGPQFVDAVLATIRSSFFADPAATRSVLSSVAVEDSINSTRITKK
jgi:hypothetical protein